MRKLGHVSLIVKDTQKLKKFYENVFGIILDFETEDKAYVESYFKELSNPKFDLEHFSLLKADMPNNSYTGFFLRFEVDDVNNIRQTIVENGGKIVREPVDQPYGKTEMWVEDPEGNLIQIYK